MEPVVSPFIIYLVGLCDTLHITGVIGCSITLLILGLWTFMMVMEDEKPNQYYKILFILALIFTLLAIFIPSKDIVLSMLAVSLITPDNISLVQGNIVDFIGQIIEAVKGVK